MSKENIELTWYAQQYYWRNFSFAEELSRLNIVDSSDCVPADYVIIFVSKCIYFITTPFLSEFLIVCTAICYLIICCFANSKWWVAPIIFRLFFWIRVIFVCLILLNTFLILTSFWKIETGLFFGNILINNFVTIVLKLLILIFVSTCISKWFRFVFQNKMFWKSINEFAFIFLCCIFFLICLISLNDFFLLLYLIVAVSLALYGLILINLPLFSNAPETGAKYFLLSVISVGLMFGGMKELYLYTGHLDLSFVKNAIFEKILNCITYQELFSIKYALFFVLLGFFFKLAAAPNHFWAPEIYTSLPYELLLFFVVPIKFVFSFIFFKIVKSVFFIYGVNDNLNFILYNETEFFLFLSIIISMVIGSVNAVFETNIRKFLAYSSINQMGFLLIGLIGTTSNFFGFASFLYFIIVYFINVFLFILFFVTSSQIFYTPTEALIRLSMPKHTELIEPDFFLDYYVFNLKNLYTLKLNFIKDLNKLYNIRYFIESTFDYGVIRIWFFIIIVFSLAGIPPLPGFYSKFYILFYAIQTKYWIIFWTGIFTSILSVFYYLRIVKVMFFEKTYFSLHMLVPSFYFESFDIFFPLYFIRFNNEYKNVIAKDFYKIDRLTSLAIVTNEKKIYSWISTVVYNFGNFSCTWESTFETRKGFTNYKFSNNDLGTFLLFPWGMLDEKIAIVKKITPNSFKVKNSVEQKNFLNIFITFILLQNKIIDEQKKAYNVPFDINQKYREEIVWNKIRQFTTHFYLSAIAQKYPNNFFVKLIIEIEMSLNQYVYNFFKEFLDTSTPLEERNLTFYNYTRMQFANVQAEIKHYFFDWNLASSFLFSFFFLSFSLYFVFENQLFNLTFGLAQNIFFF